MNAWNAEFKRDISLEVITLHSRQITAEIKLNNRESCRCYLLTEKTFFGLVKFINSIPEEHKNN